MKILLTICLLKGNQMGHAIIKIFLSFMVFAPLSFGKIRSIVDERNSTTTVLASGATFTGTWVNTLDFVDVIVSAKTDQDGMLYVDFSPDGTNSDSTLSYMAVSDCRKKPIS